MEGSGNSAEFANSPEADAANIRGEFEPAPANCSAEVLREDIGRKVMTWIGAGLQHCEDESERDSKREETASARHKRIQAKSPGRCTCSHAG